MEVWSAAGRRKSAIAQVRICSPGTGAITVNQVDAEKYLQGAFPTILKPFETVIALAASSAVCHSALTPV